MPIDTMKAVYSALTYGMPGAAQIILADAILAAEREATADVVSVPRSLAVAMKACTSKDATGAQWREFYGCRDVLERALATAPRPQSADRLVGEVAPAVPAVEPVAVAGAATLADVEARRAIVELAHAFGEYARGESSLGELTHDASRIATRLERTPSR